MFLLSSVDVNISSSLTECWVTSTLVSFNKYFFHLIKLYHYFTIKQGADLWRIWIQLFSSALTRWNEKAASFTNRRILCMRPNSILMASWSELFSSAVIIDSHKLHLRWYYYGTSQLISQSIRVPSYAEKIGQSVKRKLCLCSCFEIPTHPSLLTMRFIPL